MAGAGEGQFETPIKNRRTEKSHSRDMKLDKYDGTTSIDSFLAKFEICAEHNGWGDKERLTQLQCALTHNAAQILWDTGTEGSNTSAKPHFATTCSIWFRKSEVIIPNAAEVPTKV